MREGLERKGEVLSLGFKGFDDAGYINKRMYHMLGGLSGTGKSSLADQAYIINPFLQLDELKNSPIEEQDPIDYKVILFSMERSKELRLAKWVCQMIYRKYNILMSVPYLLSWGNRKSRVTQEQFNLVVEITEWCENLLEHVTIYDGVVTPKQFYELLIQDALSKGTSYGYIEIETNSGDLEYRKYKKRGNSKKEYIRDEEGPQFGKFQKVYVADNPKQINLFVLDHIGKLIKEHGMTDKDVLDKASEYCTTIRDVFGYSPVVVSQFNRNSLDTHRRKTPLPEEGDFAGSSKMYYDADLVYALFNPSKHQMDLMEPYNVKALNSVNGANRFRSLHLLKNSYGIDNGWLGMGYIGEVGEFRQLNPNMDEAVYSRIQKIVPVYWNQE